MVLHLKQVDQFRLPSTSLNNFVQVLLWLLNELFNARLICENAIFLGILKNTKVWFSRHQKSVMLDDIDEAES